MMPACDAACAVAVAVANARGTTGMGKIGVPLVDPLHPGSAGLSAQGACAKADGDARQSRPPTSSACATRAKFDSGAHRFHWNGAPDIPLNIPQPPKSKNKNRQSVAKLVRTAGRN